MPPVPQVSSQNIGQPGSTSASSSSPNLSASPSGDKGPDYVYFERKPTQVTESTLGKAMAAKMKLELFYKEGVEGVVGRKERYVEYTERADWSGELPWRKRWRLILQRLIR
jgi:protein-serine/threonine kinase